MATIAAFIPAIASVGSTILGAAGASKQGKAAAAQARRQAEAARLAGQQKKVLADYTGLQRQTAAYFDADQLDQNAGQAIAASQRDAGEAARSARLASSRALALAAASGGGASSPTVMKIIADIAGEGAYRRSVALYAGEERARAMRMAASGRRWEGDTARQAAEFEGDLALQSGDAGFDSGVGLASDLKSAGDIAAGGALAKGGLSLFAKYGQGGPGSMPSGLGYGTIDPTMAGANLPW